jgi:hypothetical protein
MKFDQHFFPKRYKSKYIILLLQNLQANLTSYNFKSSFWWKGFKLVQLKSRALSKWKYIPVITIGFKKCKFILDGN